MEDGHFVAFRDVSFLPSLLAPNSQSLEVCGPKSNVTTWVAGFFRCLVVVLVLSETSH